MDTINTYIIYRRKTLLQIETYISATTKSLEGRTETIYKSQ
jgi:hypothetical protein